MGFKKVVRSVVYVCLLSVFPASIVYITITDDFLCNYTSLVLLSAAVLFIFSCMSALSAATTMHIKETAFGIPLELLSDSDIDSDAEVEKIVPVPLWRFKRIPNMILNCVKFGQIHTSYGIISALGIFSLVTGSLFMALSIVLDDGKVTLKTWSEKDFLYSSAYLFLTAFVIISAILILTHAKGVYEEDTRNLNYSAFDEYVHVPRRILAGKAFVAFLTGGYIIYLILGLVFLLYGIFAVFCLLKSTKEDIQMLQQASQVDSIYPILLAVMTFAICTGIFLLGKLVKSVCDKAKKSLLTTMEENWQKNIYALEILFPAETVNRLQVLKNRLQCTRRRNWTSEEKIAYDYISRPLWKAKRAFIEKSK